MDEKWEESGEWKGDLQIAHSQSIKHSRLQRGELGVVLDPPTEKWIRNGREWTMERELTDEPKSIHQTVPPPEW